MNILVEKQKLLIINDMDCFSNGGYMVFLKFHTKRWYGGGYSVLRFSLQLVIW